MSGINHSRPFRRSLQLFPAIVLAFAACTADRTTSPIAATDASVRVRDDGENSDMKLARVLAQAGFTGRIESTLSQRLHRNVDPELADLGRLLFFDTQNGLNGDNSCAGCHNPRNGFGDSQSIAIGIDNNGIVGPDRRGPRNQRRSPVLTNVAFYPALMWNSRFHADSRDPFDNFRGFTFPPPEGRTLSYLPHLLTAQAFIPPTERVEMAGFVFPGGAVRSGTK